MTAAPTTHVGTSIFPLKLHKVFDAGRAGEEVIAPFEAEAGGWG